MDGKLDGYWVLVDKKGNNTELYTRVYADVYLNKTTKEKYARGKITPFIRKGGKPEYPPLIEDTDVFEFINEPQKHRQGNVNIKEEIYVSKMLNMLFKKK